jgi:hypothetical protein
MPCHRRNGFAAAPARRVAAHHTRRDRSGPGEEQVAAFADRRAEIGATAGVDLKTVAIDLGTARNAA